MSKKLLLIILTLALASTVVFGQQGKYVRKSVSSLESVWYKPNSLQMDFDKTTFDRFMKFYVEVERFDYNLLPQSYVRDFINQANALETINPVSLTDELSGVLKTTVADKIVEILNSPDVMKARGTELKSESGLQSFAATKAKSLGLTTEELKTLLNSAYIYLPFITKAVSETDDKGNLMVTLEGGIIWWNVVVKKDGTSEIREVLSATTTGMSIIDPKSKSSLTGAPHEFRFGNEKWQTTPEQWAQNDAMLAFAKNLGVKTKEIDDFKLSAQITEARGKKYGFPLGHREGVFLDDGFHIVEFEEDAEGNEVAIRKGFVRVSKTGKNQEDPTQLTYAKQLIGKKVSEGAVVMEHPRLGMDIKYTGTFITGSVIKPEHTEFVLLGLEPVIKEEATSQIGMTTVLSYNVAPIIGLSQTFLDIDLGLAMPVAEYNLDAGATTFIISSYFGATKKFGGRLYGAVSAGAGVDVLYLSSKITDYEDTEHTVSINYQAPGVKAQAELGFMMTEDLILYGSAGYKLGMAPIKGVLTYDDTDYEFVVTDPTYSDLNMGGIMANIGISYALGEFAGNIFGFIDPLKKF